MGIFSPLKKPLKEEVRDQLAHMLHAILLMLAVILLSWPIFAAIIVMTEALIIELKAKNWDIRRVGQRDLFFYFIACSIVIAAYYFIT